MTRGFMAEDAVSEIHLRQLSRVQIAAADPAQVHLDHDLVGPQRRTGTFLDGDLSLLGQNHCRHGHNDDLPGPQGKHPGQQAGRLRSDLSRNLSNRRIFVNGCGITGWPQRISVHCQSNNNDIYSDNQ
jgi:hypothetical protein